jgi:hypothetical protein
MNCILHRVSCFMVYTYCYIGFCAQLYKPTHKILNCPLNVPSDTLRSHFPCFCAISFCPSIHSSVYHPLIHKYKNQIPLTHNPLLKRILGPRIPPQPLNLILSHQSFSLGNASKSIPAHGAHLTQVNVLISAILYFSPTRYVRICKRSSRTEYRRLVSFW